jgi:hypothetical protein
MLTKIKKIALLIIGVLLYSGLTNCSSIKNKIYFEREPVQLINNENKFDLDNTIYTLNKSFLFKFSLLQNNVHLDTNVKYIRMLIIGGTKPFSNFDPTYNQTVIQYQYLDSENTILFSEKTGLVENTKNIWFHPPRTEVAGILQLSAFPYIKLNKFKKWKWELEAAYDNYQSTIFTHTYKRLEKFQYKVGSKNLQCIPIIAITESEIGITNSKFLYNEKYGFVFMEFNNIDKSKIILELIDY